MNSLFFILKSDVKISYEHLVVPLIALCHMCPMESRDCFYH